MNVSDEIKRTIAYGQDRVYSHFCGHCCALRRTLLAPELLSRTMCPQGTTSFALSIVKLCVFKRPLSIVGAVVGAVDMTAAHENLAWSRLEPATWKCPMTLQCLERRLRRIGGRRHDIPAKPKLPRRMAFQYLVAGAWYKAHWIIFIFISVVSHTLVSVERKNVSSRTNFCRSSSTVLNRWWNQTSSSQMVFLACIRRFRYF